MSAVNLAEGLINLIIEQIKTNISSALTEVRTQRNDGSVTTEIPASYFIYNDAIAYKTPAIFVLAGDIDFQLARGQNHINNETIVYVSCAVEDRNQAHLTVKVYRYLDALFKVLNRVQLVDTSTGAKNFVKVTRVDLSRVEKKSSTDSIFRKEVMFTLAVEHMEQEN